MTEWKHSSSNFKNVLTRIIYDQYLLKIVNFTRKINFCSKKLRLEQMLEESKIRTKYGEIIKMVLSGKIDIKDNTKSW